jgi:hypothetical protein
MVVMVELTCPFDSEGGFKAAQERKQRRYEGLKAECEGAGYDTRVITVEVGSRGVVWPEGMDELVALQRDARAVSIGEARRRMGLLKRGVGSIAMHCSWVIWSARRAPQWQSPPFYCPPGKVK